VVQVEAAAQLGDALSIRELGWVKSLYWAAACSTADQTRHTFL
jgi:hypothetical protein